MATASELPLNAPAESYSQEELAGRAAVLAFYDALDGRDIAKARQFLHRDFVQHSPRIGPGADGLAEYFEALWRAHPSYDLIVKRAYVDGDLVMLHVHAVGDGTVHGQAMAEIYRVEDGRIAEHWETMQAIPEVSANQNGMFYGD